jgi:hypothetical protein
MLDCLQLARIDFKIKNQREANGFSLLIFR